MVNTPTDDTPASPVKVRVLLAAIDDTPVPSKLAPVPRLMVSVVARLRLTRLSVPPVTTVPPTALPRLAEVVISRTAPTPYP